GHAEARREEGGGERHDHLPAVDEGLEQPLGLGRIHHRERERKALKAWLTPASAVGGHHGRLTHTEARMHHLVLGTRLDHRPIGTVLVTQEARHLGADGLAVELERLLAAPLEEQVRLDLRRKWRRHSSLLFWPSGGRTARPPSPPIHHRGPCSAIRLTTSVRSL